MSGTKILKGLRLLNNANIGGNAKVTGAFNTESTATIAGKLTASSAADVAGVLSVADASYNVSAGEYAINATGGIKASGINAGGITTADTDVDISRTLKVTGDDGAEITNSASIGGKLTVTGSDGAEIANSASIGGKLTVTGSDGAEIENHFAAKSTATISGVLTASSTATIDGALTAKMGATVSGAELEATAGATVSGAVFNAQRGATITGAKLTASKGASVTGGLDADSLSISDRLTVNGDLVVTGTTTTVRSENTMIQDGHILLHRGTATAALTPNSGFVVSHGATSESDEWNGWTPRDQLEMPEFQINDSDDFTFVDEMIVDASYTADDGSAHSLGIFVLKSNNDPDDPQYSCKESNGDFFSSAVDPDLVPDTVDRVTFTRIKVSVMSIEAGESDGYLPHWAVSSGSSLATLSENKSDLVNEKGGVLLNPQDENGVSSGQEIKGTTHIKYAKTEQVQHVSQILEPGDTKDPLRHNILMGEYHLQPNQPAGIVVDFENGHETEDGPVVALIVDSGPITLGPDEHLSLRSNGSTWDII